MKMNNLREIITEQQDESENLIFLDGFDEAIIGLSMQENKVVYSFTKGISILTETMSYEDALDYFYFNVNSLGGDNFPIWVRDDLG